MKISELADQVRNIPLREVLERYGFEAKPKARRSAQRASTTTSLSPAVGGSTTRPGLVAQARLIW
jgi:hypothetical protein